MPICRCGRRANKHEPRREESNWRPLPCSPPMGRPLLAVAVVASSASSLVQLAGRTSRAREWPWRGASRRKEALIQFGASGHCCSRRASCTLGRLAALCCHRGSCAVSSPSSRRCLARVGLVSSALLLLLLPLFLSPSLVRTNSQVDCEQAKNLPDRLARWGGGRGQSVRLGFVAERKKGTKTMSEAEPRGERRVEPAQLV